MQREIYDAYPPPNHDNSLTDSPPLSHNFHFSSLVAESQDHVLQEARSLLAQWSENTVINSTIGSPVLLIDHGEDFLLEHREIQREIGYMIPKQRLEKVESPPKRSKLASNPGIIMEARQIIQREKNLLRSSGKKTSRPRDNKVVQK